MRFHVLSHVPHEGLGSMESWILHHQHSLSETPFWLKHRLPSQDDFDALIVMGGPMNIYEEDAYPWLKDEKKFIETAIQSGKKVLGICLGAQLIADVLGGPVRKNKYKEIGWMPIEWREAAQSHALFSHFSKSMTVFHWHGDTFQLPKAAVPLAKSAGCENQAFIFEDRVMGLQFHLEATPDLVKAFLKAGHQELQAEGPFIQTEKEILSEVRHFKEIQKASDLILDSMTTKESRLESRVALHSKSKI